MSLQTLIQARKSQLAAEKAAQEAARKAAAEAALRERLAQVEKEIQKDLPIFLESVQGQVPRTALMEKEGIDVEQEVKNLQLQLKNKCISLAALEQNFRAKKKEVEKEKARLEKEARPIRNLLREARELGLQDTPEFKSEQFKLLALEQKEKELDQALEETRRKKNRAFGQACGILNKLRELGGEPLATCQWFADRVDNKKKSIQVQATKELTVALGEVAAGLATIEIKEQPQKAVPQKEEVSILQKGLKLLEKENIGLQEMVADAEYCDLATEILKEDGWSKEEIDRFFEKAEAEAERLGLI